jgi:hypothetical protein
VNYNSLLSNRNYFAAIDMLSKRNIDDLVTNSSKNEFANYFPMISTINELLIKELGRFEEIHNSKGCLTVFGLDSSNEPTSMNLEFVSEIGHWKLDYVQVMYHSSKPELPEKVKCPERMEN